MKKPTSYTPLAILSGQISKEPVGRESDKFMLRMPDGMRDRISEAAKANNRSMNSEIVARIDSSFALAEEVAHLRDGLETYRKLSGIQQDMLRKTGQFLAMVLDLIPISSDSDKNLLSEWIKAYAQAVTEGDVSGAISAVEQIVALHPSLAKK
ncbi:Arc family DNA-binding protein [Robbsia andropogonis]|uniref:Arc family DNA-binding protein n=1 Tax=Robbsia andropogonis TaxID=28092 RepID=UPI003D19B8DD